ncbi:MAG: FAD-binding protein [Coriobacteriales bacterium]|jgi:fumarate reductase flavoprotein subunit|nr:FAD-binding protein [Coriobacteriales bacterium]
MNPILEMMMEGPNSAQLEQADSIEELAAKLDIPAATLQETVTSYNGYCAVGDDPEFEQKALVPLTEPPFYGGRFVIATTRTFGGLKTHTDVQVLGWALTEDDEVTTAPILGLYAAGEVVEWNAYTDWTTSRALTMGRIAGRNAAAG